MDVNTVLGQELSVRIANAIVWNKNGELRVQIELPRIQFAMKSNEFHRIPMNSNESQCNPMKSNEIK